MQLDSLKARLSSIEGKDPIIMWTNIQEMVKNAGKFEIIAKVIIQTSTNHWTI